MESENLSAAYLNYVAFVIYADILQKKIFLYIGPSISISKDGSPLSVLLNVNKIFFFKSAFFEQGMSVPEIEIGPFREML